MSVEIGSPDLKNRKAKRFVTAGAISLLLQIDHDKYMQITKFSAEVPIPKQGYLCRSPAWIQFDSHIYLASWQQDFLPGLAAPIALATLLYDAHAGNMEQNNPQSGACYYIWDFRIHKFNIEPFVRVLANRIDAERYNRRLGMGARILASHPSHPTGRESRLGKGILRSVLLPVKLRLEVIPPGGLDSQ